MAASQKNSYESPSWWYDLRGLFILTFAYNDFLWRQIAFFAKNIRSHHLEVACGSGTLLKIILTTHSKLKNAQIEAFDYSPNMLAGAFKRFRKNKKVHLFQGDATQLQFSDQQFDSISVANAIHCIHPIDKALREMHRVLRPEGTLAMNVLLEPRAHGLLAGWARKINAWGKKKGILYEAFEESKILQLLQEIGFTISYQRRFGNALYLTCKK